MAFLFLFESKCPVFNLRSLQATSGIGRRWYQGSRRGKIAPDLIATSDTAGWVGYDVGNFYLTNDNKYLYFWMDAKNVPQLGWRRSIHRYKHLNVDHTDSGYDRNPWEAQFNFSGN